LEQVPSVWSGADAAAVAAARAATMQSATSTQYLRPELASRPNLPPDDDVQLCTSHKHKLWTAPAELQQVAQALELRGVDHGAAERVQLDVPVDRVVEDLRVPPARRGARG